MKGPAPLAKNNHARILPLSKKTAKALNTLIKENSIFENGDFIFLSNYGGRIDPSWVRARIKEYGERAKIENIRVSPHTFRHREKAESFLKIKVLRTAQSYGAPEKANAFPSCDVSLPVSKWS